MGDSKIEKTKDLRNFEHKEYIEVDSTGWHLKPNAPENVKKRFREYMEHIDKGKRDVYFGKNYDSKRRFLSYWHQIEEARKIKPESSLEIGVGNKFTSDYLKKRDFNITTLDHNPHLKPDTVGSVLNIPFKRNAFELVMCYEVLEHMPFDKFRTALGEIKRVSKKYALISLPEKNKIYFLNLRLPILGKIEKQIEISLPEFLKSEVSEPDYVRGHYWEIGKKDHSLEEIKRVIREVGFSIKKTYTPIENPKHRFFVLKNVKNNERKNQ